MCDDVHILSLLQMSVSCTDFPHHPANSISQSTFPHWSRVSLYGSVYTQVYIHMSILCKPVSYHCGFPKIAEKLRSLESYLEITSCRTFCLRTKHLFLLVLAQVVNKITHNATSLSWETRHGSLWGNLWHHSTGHSLGLSFAPGSCGGKHWMGWQSGAPCRPFYFLGQWPCPSAISSGE